MASHEWAPDSGVGDGFRRERCPQCGMVVWRDGPWAGKGVLPSPLERSPVWETVPDDCDLVLVHQVHSLFSFVQLRSLSRLISDLVFRTWAAVFLFRVLGFMLSVILAWP